MEVVDLPLFDVQFNEIVVGGASLDVHKASSLDVLHEEVSQGDVLWTFC